MIRHARECDETPDSTGVHNGDVTKAVQKPVVA